MRGGGGRGVAWQRAAQKPHAGVFALRGESCLCSSSAGWLCPLHPFPFLDSSPLWTGCSCPPSHTSTYKTQIYWRRRRRRGEWEGGEWQSAEFTAIAATEQFGCQKIKRGLKNKTKLRVSRCQWDKRPYPELFSESMATYQLIPPPTPDPKNCLQCNKMILQDSFTFREQKEKMSRVQKEAETQIDEKPFSGMRCVTLPALVLSC